jgi:hypothetical protein
MNSMDLANDFEVDAARLGSAGSTSFESPRAHVDVGRLRHRRADRTAERPDARERHTRGEEGNMAAPRKSAT